MPIYEYVCRDCGEPIEKLQKLSDPPLTDCPACGKSALKRKMSAAGFRLAGSGWYETDFKQSGKRNLAGETKDSAGSKAGSGAKADSSSGSKSETKPQGKTENKRSDNKSSSSPA